MKKLAIILICAATAGGAFADTVAATLRADGTTNTWTAAELQDALGLMNRMYWREMTTDAGRRKWHGNRIGQYVLTNGEQMVRIDLYADGFTSTNVARRAGRGAFDPEAAAKAAIEAKRREDEARAAWERANLPPELAAIRAAQRAAQGTNEVTVIIEAN